MPKKKTKPKRKAAGWEAKPNFHGACLSSSEAHSAKVRLAHSSASSSMDGFFYGYRQGTKEYAGHLGAELDKAMASGLSLRDQEILYEFRQRVVADMKRRYPAFDFEKEIGRHA